MKKVILLIILILFMAQGVHAMVKVRDITNVEGVRDNQLVGYGLVVGLNGTGDKSGSVFTMNSLANMMERMGVSVSSGAVKVKNVAAVMVTARLKPFAKAGTKMDVTVSSVGDSKSLEGGTLLMTPLSAANGQVYAVAQGPLSVGGMNVSTSGAKAVKNHPTVGAIPNGAIIEQEVQYQLDQKSIVLNFKDNNLSDVVKARSAINRLVGADVATVSSPSSLSIIVPDSQKTNYYGFMDRVLNAEIEPTDLARVVVDERTGTIVMGADVKVSTVAISQGNLTINVTSTVTTEPGIPQDSKPAQDKKTSSTQISAKEESAKLMVIPEPLSISDLVKALNSVGVTPRDLISILQAIESAGALHGDLQIM